MRDLGICAHESAWRQALRLCNRLGWAQFPKQGKLPTDKMSAFLANPFLVNPPRILALPQSFLRPKTICWGGKVCPNDLPPPSKEAFQEKFHKEAFSPEMSRRRHNQSSEMTQRFVVDKQKYGIPLIH